MNCSCHSATIGSTFMARHAGMKSLRDDGAQAQAFQGISDGEAEANAFQRTVEIARPVAETGFEQSASFGTNVGLTGA
jgi:hypothetical protein